MHKLALLVIEAGRNYDLYGNVKVALTVAVERRNALTPQPERRIGLGTFRHPKLFLTVKGRHFEIGPERRLGDRNRNGTEEVVAAAFEEGVMAHSHHHIEVPRFASQPARLTFSAHSQARTLINSGWYFQAQHFFLSKPALAAAVRTHIPDHLARTTALRTGTSEGKEALLLANGSASAAEPCRLPGDYLFWRPYPGRTGRLPDAGS